MCITNAHICERNMNKFRTNFEQEQSHKTVMLKKELLDKIRKALPADWYERICKIIGNDLSLDSIRMILSDPQRNKKGNNSHVIDAAVKIVEEYQGEVEVKEQKINDILS